MPAINELSDSIYHSMPRTKTNLVQDLGHRWILVGCLKLFRFMSVMMVQTKCKLNNAELFLKCFYLQSKEIGNQKYYEETRELENGKVRFCLNIDVRKEKDCSWLNVIKTKIAFVKGRLKFSSKSKTAANVHLMESHLGNWLKNNHITVDKIYYLRILLVPGFYLRV